MRVPRAASGEDPVKALARLGYEKTRQTSSHVRLTTMTAVSTMCLYRIIKGSSGNGWLGVLGYPVVQGHPICFMATTAVTVQEYLSTPYDPDCDYVDGEVVERNLGEFDHARLQTAIAIYFGERRKEWGICVVVEQRVQVSPTRFRVPDVCVVLSEPKGQILREPPFICIEVLSPEDRVSRVNEKVADYLQFGVQYVWILDPQTRKGWRCTPGAVVEVTELRTENPAMVVPLEELFT